MLTETAIQHITRRTEVVWNPLSNWYMTGFVIVCWLCRVFGRPLGHRSVCEVTRGRFLALTTPKNSQTRQKRSSSETELQSNPDGQFHDGFCFYWPLPFFHPQCSASQDYIILQTVYRETKTSADNVSISGRGNGPEIGLSQGLSCVKGRWPAMYYSPQLSWHRKRQCRLCSAQYGTHKPGQEWGRTHTHTQYCNQCAD